MKINVFVVSKVSDDVGSIAVGCYCDDQKFERSYKIPNCKSVNQASAMATLFALNCFSSAAEVSLNVNNRYMIGMLDHDDNGWLKAANANADIIADIRAKVDSFKKFEVKYDRNSKEITSLNSSI